MYCETGAMGKDSTQGDFLLRSKFILFYLPAFQIEIHIFIQTDLSFLHQGQGSQSSHRFADGSCLEEGMFIYHMGAIYGGIAISFCPFNLPSF